MRRFARGQKVFRFPNGWGGNRKWTRRGERRTRAPHRRREVLAPRFPVHVTMRVRDGLPSLRRRREFLVVREALSRGADRFGFRLNQFSVQTNHLHLVVEAQGQKSLARGMQGLSIRFAKALNRLWDRKGSVLAQRYHSVVLRSPRQVRNALLYVLNNARKHGRRMLASVPDPCSSGPWFDGWRDYRSSPMLRGLPPVVRATTFLQRVLWRRYGLLTTHEEPAAP